MISNSFLESSMHTPLIIQKRNKDTADAHIIINWLSVDDDSHFQKDKSSLAYGYGPGSGIGGNVTMNADVLWLLRKTPLLAKEAKELGYIKNYADPNTVIKYYDPLHTIKHEGGHALGMDHIPDIKYKSSSVMYPFYNGLRIFGQADIDYITSLYGKASVPESTKKTIRDRISQL